MHLKRGRTTRYRATKAVELAGAGGGIRSKPGGVILPPQLLIYLPFAPGLDEMQ